MSPTVREILLAGATAWHRGLGLGRLRLDRGAAPPARLRRFALVRRNRRAPSAPSALAAKAGEASQSTARGGSGTRWSRHVPLASIPAVVAVEPGAVLERPSVLAGPAVIVAVVPDCTGEIVDAALAVGIPDGARPPALGSAVRALQGCGWPYLGCGLDYRGELGSGAAVARPAAPRPRLNPTPPPPPKRRPRPPRRWLEIAVAHAATARAAPQHAIEPWSLIISSCRKTGRFDACSGGWRGERAVSRETRRTRYPWCRPGMSTDRGSQARRR